MGRLETDEYLSFGINNNTKKNRTRRNLKGKNKTNWNVSELQNFVKKQDFNCLLVSKAPWLLTIYFKLDYGYSKLNYIWFDCDFLRTKNSHVISEYGH